MASRRSSAGEIIANQVNVSNQTVAMDNVTNGDSSTSKKNDDKEINSSSTREGESSSENAKFPVVENFEDINFERTDTMWLLKGEEIKAHADDVTYLCPYAGRLRGDIFVTNFKLFFKCTSADEGMARFIPSLNQHNFLVLLGCVSEVKKVSYTKNRENSYNLDIICKDLRVLRFSHKSENHSRRPVYNALISSAFPVSRNAEIFAYTFRKNYPEFESKGWQIFDAEEECKKMACDLWKTTNINTDYGFCASYPSVLVVPAEAKEKCLASVADHRTRNRLPVITWVHPDYHPVILRCSQPTSGLIDKPSDQDIGYFRLIWEANSDQKIYVVDARPKKNAVANKLKGGGFEANEKYEAMELEFLDIENIHVMRDSLNKLREVCYAIDDVHWFANLDSTKWLDHIKVILAGAIFIVDLVERRCHSVVVHCSDGWDRTAQLTGLSLLLLDPEYRTIKGFEILIEKEWLSFGHKFAQRIGHGENKPHDSERSPVFLQFMDCVWQISQQFPCAFEFNERFLITILDHLYSCLFGTFLYDCEKTRVQHKLKTTTFSLWDYINLNIKDYENVQYARHEHVIYPNASLRYINLWSSYYLRWNPRTRRQESEHNHYKAVENACNQLLKRISDIKQDMDVSIRSNHSKPINQTRV